MAFIYSKTSSYNEVKSRREGHYILQIGCAFLHIFSLLSSKSYDAGELLAKTFNIYIGGFLTYEKNHYLQQSFILSVMPHYFKMSHHLLASVFMNTC